MPVWEEGFDITVVEAMAAGCVCICAAKGGIPEIIEDGVNGYLIKSGTAEELADILQEVIPQYVEGKFVDAQKNAVRRSRDFSIETYSENLDQYFSTL